MLTVAARLSHWQLNYMVSGGIIVSSKLSAGVFYMYPPIKTTVFADRINNNYAGDYVSRVS